MDAKAFPVELSFLFLWKPRDVLSSSQFSPGVAFQLCSKTIACPSFIFVYLYKIDEIHHMTFEGHQVAISNQFGANLHHDQLCLSQMVLSVLNLSKKNN
jgi:hypothetical protein